MRGTGKGKGPKAGMVLTDMRRVYRGRVKEGEWTESLEGFRKWLEKRPEKFLTHLMALERQHRQEVLRYREQERLREKRRMEKEEKREKELAKAFAEEGGEPSVVQEPEVKLVTVTDLPEELDAAEERCEEVTERLLRGWGDVKQGELEQVRTDGRAGERGVSKVVAAAGAGPEEPEELPGGTAEEVSG